MKRSKAAQDRLTKFFMIERDRANIKASDRMMRMLARITSEVAEKEFAKLLRVKKRSEKAAKQSPR